MTPNEVRGFLEGHSYEYETRPILRHSDGRPIIKDGDLVRGDPEARTYEIKDIGDWMDGIVDGGSYVSGLGQVETIESHGGEGEGDSAWFVVRVTADDGTETLYKMHGSYQSYDGFYWDGPFVEVKPVEKVVTVYEEVR